MCPFYNHDNTKQENTLFRIKVKEMMEEKEIEISAGIMEEIITRSLLENREIVFLCIGSDRYVGDSLGPLVGTLLRESNVPYHVYGTLKEPVHAFNLKDMLKDINKQLKKPLIISIDACLGEKSQVGYITFNKGPLAPGGALEKILPKVGDYPISLGRLIFSGISIAIAASVIAEKFLDGNSTLITPIFFRSFFPRK